MRTGRYTAVTSFLLFISYAGGVPAAGLAGYWTGVDLVERNKVDSWKPICGNRPPRHKRLPKGPYKIKTFQKEFNIFLGTKLFLSSYKCNSRNDYVKRREHSVKRGLYTTTCGSSKADKIFEVGTYTFKVVHHDRIEYSENSTLLSTKEGVECSFEHTLKGIFVRKGSVEESVVLGMEAGQKAEAGQGDENRKCPPPDSARPVATLKLTPARQVLAPGQRACFKAVALDAAGCPVEAVPKFRLGNLSPGLAARVDANGCVSVKDAPGLGVSFRVLAGLGPRQASSKIVIGISKVKRTTGKVSKKIGEKADVRIDIRSLEPSGEVDKAWLKRHQQELQNRAGARRRAEGTNWFLLALIFGMILAAGIALFVALKSHGKAAENEEIIFYSAPRPSNTLVATMPKLELKRCPKCKKTFQSNAKFCPFDRNELEVLNPDAPAMVAEAHGGSLRHCPKCGRIFESRGKFCPFDRTKLDEISAEEAAELSARSGKKSLKCPKCGRVFEQGKFCPFDSTRLEEIGKKG
ncbi:MAG: zinc ribbon domain-containing protein [Deltaproteobacteria bacterium]|nr:zinc ribbon domain-containing protein [Deltaproteobacteria bacterium]